MASVVGANQVKLANGKVVTAQTGGWYDGQQFVNGTLSQTGVINSQSNQQGAGQAVSQEVNRQTSVAAGLAPNANQDFINKQNGTQPAADASLPGTPGFSGGGGTGGGMPSGGGVGITPVASLDLPALYNNLYNNSGIHEKQTQLDSEAKAFADAQSKINDNPFLSEANRVGRVQKLQNDYNLNTKNLQDEVATRKADIETQMNIQTKQFDINSQAAQQSLAQFNSLLESGALAGASGEDIANITRSTGMSSSMIQSAINANKQKNVQTQTIQFDDGTNQGYAIVNSQTGEIISRQTVSASKPTSSGGGGSASTFGSKQFTASEGAALQQFITSKANSYGDLSPADWQAALNAFISAGLGSKTDFIKQYSSYADINRGDFESAYGFAKPKK